MKKAFGWVILAAFLFSGCAAPELETVSDVYEQRPLAAMQQIVLDLPQEAAQPVMESGDGAQLYLCDGYELRVQTMEAENLDEVLRAVTGHGREQLTVMQTAAGENQRYDCVWCTAGEEGELVGRTAILDDGNYFYCVSALAKSESALELRQTWQQVLDSFVLG